MRRGDHDRSGRASIGSATRLIADSVYQLARGVPARTIHTCAYCGPAPPLPSAWCDDGPGSMTPTVRVLVVDDQLAFHDAARAVLDAAAGFEWIGGASCGEEGVSQAERLRPDLVLMDVRMPGIGGVEAARQIASLGLSAIVVLTTAGPPLNDGGRGIAAEVVPKERLCGALLRRLWEDYA